MPRQMGLRSEKDVVSIVKHNENEQSATTTTKKHSKIDLFDFRFSCSLCFHNQHVRDLTLYHVFLVPLVFILMPSGAKHHFGTHPRIPRILRIPMKWSLSRRSDPPFHTRRGLG